MDQFSGREPEDSRITRLETQMDFVLERLRAPPSIKEIEAVPNEPKRFLGMTEETLMKWLIILALSLSAGGNLPSAVENLAKTVQQ